MKGVTPMSKRNLFSSFMIVGHQSNTEKLLEKLSKNFEESQEAKFIAKYKDEERKDIILYFIYQPGDIRQKDITLNSKNDANMQILNTLTSIPAFIKANQNSESDNKTIEALILDHQAMFDLDSLRSLKSPVSFNNALFKSDHTTGKLTNNSLSEENSPVTDDLLSINSKI